MGGCPAELVGREAESADAFAGTYEAADRMSVMGAATAEEKGCWLDAGGGMI
jgi:hypothetical protein